MAFHARFLATLRAQAPGGLSAPSGLNVVRDGGYTRMLLSWTDNSTGEDGFKIERSTDGSSWSQITTVGAGVTTYIDTGRTRGQIYYYRVRAYQGANNSAYSNTDSDTIAQFSDFTYRVDINPEGQVYTDSAGTTLVSADGDLVRRVNNVGTIGGNFQVAADTNRPTWQDNEVNGKATLRFATDDYLRDSAATAATWKFLHDGSGYSIVIVWKTTSSNPNALMYFLDTLGGTSGAVGFNLLFDDRSGTRLDAVGAWIGKGTLGTFHADATTHNEGVKAGKWHVTGIRYDGALGSNNLANYNDGGFAADALATKSGTASTSNPAGYLRIGANISAGSLFNGDIARILITDSALSDADFQTLQEMCDEEYGVIHDTSFLEESGLKWWGASSVVQYSATGNDHAGWPGLCVAENGDLVMAYNKATSHNAFNGSLVVRRSTDDGATWGSEQTLWDYVTDGGSTTMWVVGGLTTLANGDIWLAVGKRVSGAVVVDGIGYFKSTDDGATWSAVTQITSSAYTTFCAEGGQILELANGNLLFPFYADSAASGTWDAVLLRSTDGGSTWGSEVTIGDGSADSKQYAEPGLFQLGSTVYALIRNNTNTNIRYATSADNGATWSALTDAVLGSGRMNPVKLSTGQVLTALRYTQAADDPCSLLFTDDGTTYQSGREFDRSPNFTDAQMAYGQFAELPDGSIGVAYSQEASGQGVADVEFAKTA